MNHFLEVILFHIFTNIQVLLKRSYDEFSYYNNNSSHNKIVGKSIDKDSCSNYNPKDMIHHNTTNVKYLTPYMKVSDGSRYSFDEIDDLSSEEDIPVTLKKITSCMATVNTVTKSISANLNKNNQHPPPIDELAREDRAGCQQNIKVMRISNFEEEEYLQERKAIDHIMDVSDNDSD